jgi:O-antigen/teichoic acid export membrane protein
MPARLFKLMTPKQTGFRIAGLIRSMIPPYHGLRTPSVDSATPVGRSRERYRRVTLTTLSSVAARGVNILTLMISIPLTVGYLGTERYGLWVTMASLTTLLGFADLGIGNGLVNAVAEANGRDDREGARRCVSSAFFLLTGIAVALGAVFVLIHGSIPWPRIFNISSPLAISEAGLATAMFAGCFLAGLPLGVAQRVQTGYQEGFVTAGWQAVGSVLALAGVIAGINARASLPWLVLSMAGAPVVVYLANSILEFGLRRPWVRPALRFIHFRSARRMLRLGLLFFVIQIAMVVGYQTDNLIVAQILGSDQVTQYSIPLRLFMLVPTLLMLAFAPLWPAYGEALARGDVHWAVRTFQRSLMVTVAVSLPSSMLLVLMGEAILHLWVGPSVSPSFMLLLGLGVWAVVASVGNAMAMFLNGANAMGFQAICATLMMMANISLSIVLTWEIGLPGPVWGSAIAHAALVTIPSAAYIRLLLLRFKATPSPEGRSLAFSGYIQESHPLGRPEE